MGTLTLRREDGRIICETVQVADNPMRRMRGLLGRKRLDPTEGIVLRPAFSIHTGFMRFPIDAIFLDENLEVLRIEAEMRPWRQATLRGAREVVEVAAGECARRGLEVGDRVAWASHAELTQAPSVEVRPPAPGPPGRALIVSGDARFAKLARFLLEGRGVAVLDPVPPERLLDVVEHADIDAVVLDVGDELAQGLRLAGSAAGLRPELELLLVAETDAAARAPASPRVYDKWSETEQVVDAVAAAVAAGSSGERAGQPDGG